MGEDPSEVGTSVADEQKSPEQLRREIEETRQDLGDTAAALASKTDVKARAKEKVSDIKESVADKKESFTSSAGGDASSPSVASQATSKVRQNPVVVAAVAAFIGGYLIGRIRS